MESLTSQQRIREFYDKISPHYQRLWGSHLHHGYYATALESREQATEELIKLLVKKASLKHGSKVLDVGCGIGGTSIWLNKHYHCDVTGITISPKQVEIATQASIPLSKRPKFLTMDANDIDLKDTYDVVWAVEVLSHLHNHPNFFRKCRHLLKKDGTFCAAAWIKADNLTEREEKKYIQPIQEGMVCLLPTGDKYLKLLDENNFRIICYEDISQWVKKTWDMGLDIIKDRSLWKLATQYRKEGLTHLKAFRSMKRGYNKRKLLYVIIVAKKS